MRDARDEDPLRFGDPACGNLDVSSGIWPCDLTRMGLCLSRQYLVTFDRQAQAVGNAFFAELARPRKVFGPVLARAFARLAFILRSLVKPRPSRRLAPSQSLAVRRRRSFAFCPRLEHNGDRLLNLIALEHGGFNRAQHVFKRQPTKPGLSTSAGAPVRARGHSLTVSPACLPSSLFLLPLSQPHSWAAAIFIDELDAGGFESAPNDFKGRTTRLTYPCFKLVHCHDAHARVPSIQATPGPPCIGSA